MSSASYLRAEIERTLANRIPSALTPVPKLIQPLLPSGIGPADDLLGGGLPLGAITEVVGAESSGRTSFALSFVAQMTQDEKVCAWVDVSDNLCPESAAASGVILKSLLWVRCGVLPSGSMQQQTHKTFTLPEKFLKSKPIKRSLHGGGFWPHPRGEVKGLPDSIGSFLHPQMTAPRCAEPQRRAKPETETFEPISLCSIRSVYKSTYQRKPWSRIEEALRVTDLLLQGGGFSAIVLDMGSVTPEYASRVPLATWFRYRAAAEKTQANILLLTQHACSKSSAGLILRLQSNNALQQDSTFFSGIEHQVEISRQRFEQTPSKIITLRNATQNANTANWQTHTTWAGR